MVEVIRTETLYGEGVEEDPMRIITQYWTMDGKEIAREDHRQHQGGE